MRKLIPVVLLLAVACRDKAPAPNLVTRATTPRLAPEMRLTAHGGQVFDLQNERGNVVLIFFGYTHCPDICPTTLADFAGVKRRLEGRADSVKFVFISVDPARDTPEKAMAYARNFDRSFIGLTGDSASLAQIQRGFRTASYIERDTSPDYLVAHSASVYIIGADGTVHETLRFGGGGVDQMLPVVKELLDKAVDPGPAAATVSDPWVRVQGDITAPSAGYLELANPGPTPVVVRGVTCEAVRMVTMHESKQDAGGLVRMVAVESLVVPAGGRVSMRPGGMHLMLMGLERALNVGESRACALQTSARDIAFRAPVRAP